jgi:catechol 2,3-dioxygenase-like lactoylglutathione lyase family enzyme
MCHDDRTGSSDRSPLRPVRALSGPLIQDVKVCSEMNVKNTIFISCAVGSELPSRAFYRDLLGLAEANRPPALAVRAGHWFEGEDVQLCVTSDDIRTTDDAARGARVCLDLDGLAERLAANGFPVTWDKDGLAIDGFQTRDPHGNTLRFTRDETGVEFTCRGRVDGLFRRHYS